MPGAHVRSCPECNNKAEHYRMAHKYIKQWCDKRLHTRFPVVKIIINLLQAEQIKMIDKKCTEQYNEPSKKIKAG